ncbi:LPXTG cell wall anchor domain-containing protein [Candidatus Enterococcus mansonii]|uniref:Uncharacterized protein n=1 Tax=Candidatus Enterococcus mansonii TaxID=1834181 RepID=A0A242CFM6_9ENTE|nr:LPXTG cell wall anchor domain-containing protein [Enterococcus sp. 4G2_DIV0659]OTO08969.1 hypothetical protein A5880_001969 [Enterococcus sp. 4G2_DIV0659]
MKKLSYLWLLLIFGTIFVQHFPNVYATSDDNATSKIGIRFTDNRELIEEQSSTTEEQSKATNEYKPIEETDKSLPSTNEQPALYLMMIGLIVIGCVVGWMGYKKSRNK